MSTESSKNSQQDSENSKVVPLRPIQNVIDQGYEKLENLKKVLKIDSSPPDFDKIFPQDERVFTVDTDVVSTSRLEQIIKGIHREGKLEEVVSVLENVEQTLKEYKQDPIFYRIVFPVPFLMVKDIKRKFVSNPVTKSFEKYLYKSWKLSIILWIYGGSISLLILGLLVIGITLLNHTVFLPSLIVWFVFAVWLYGQVWFFEDTMKNVVFLKIYDHICAVFENAYRDHLKLVCKTYELSQDLERRKLEYQRNKEINRLEQSERLEKDWMELQVQQSLLHLNGVVALYTEATEAQKKIIRNVGDLDRLKQERKIMDEKEEKERTHELALASIESLTRIMEKRAGVLEESDAQRQEIEYNINLLKSMKNALQEHQNGAFAMENYYEAMNKVTENMMKKDNNQTTPTPQQTSAESTVNEIEKMIKNPRKI